MYRLPFLLVFPVFVVLQCAMAVESGACDTVPAWCAKLLRIEFPEARDRYVIVNGCNYIGKTEPWDFTAACVEHDKCYSTIGSSASRCNSEFRENLIAICRYQAARSGKNSSAAPCIEFALQIHQIAKITENWPTTYKANQELARKYLNRLEEVCGITARDCRVQAVRKIN
jgi:hypothetical protein